MKLRRIKTLLLVCVSVGIFSSCQKEADFGNTTITPGGVNTKITGDWQFIGLNSKTYVKVSVSQGGEDMQTITTSDYVTENNVGTVKITDGQFIFKGLGYTINDQAHSDIYIGGVLLDAMDMPFEFTNPPTDNTTDYVRNTNDSLTFKNGVSFVPDPSGTPTATAALVGARFSVAGDTLTVSVITNEGQTITQGGIPATFQARLEGTLKFKRQ